MKGRWRRAPWGRRGMKHLIVAASMLLGALAITLGAANVLQGVATAGAGKPTEPFVVDAAGPANKLFGLKKPTGRTHENAGVEARLTTW